MRRKGEKKMDKMKVKVGKYKKKVKVSKQDRGKSKRLRGRRWTNETSRTKGRKEYPRKIKRDLGE